jgi:hypothetical protein
MAIAKRRSASHEPDLSTKSDFQLLNEFTALASPESSRLKAVAWEIMRRYTANLETCSKPEPKDYSSTLGDARWGDAKRVERIFGIKRGVLLGLVAKGLVITSSLDGEGSGDKSCAAVRAKRLYCLISVAACVEAGVAGTAPRQ